MQFPDRTSENLSDSGHEHVQQAAGIIVERGIRALANQVKLAPRQVVLQSTLTQASDDVIDGDSPEEHQATALGGRARVRQHGMVS